MVSMVAGYWWLPAGTRTLCSGEYFIRYSKAVLLSGSPYSVSHACPAVNHLLILHLEARKSPCWPTQRVPPNVHMMSEF